MSCLLKFMPESYFNAFLRWCETFWLLTIKPLDQNWSTYATMKVVVMKKSRKNWNCNDFIVSNENVSHHLKNALQ